MAGMSVSPGRRDPLAELIARKIDDNQPWDIHANVEVGPDELVGLAGLSRLEIDAIAPHMLASSLLSVDNSPNLGKEIQFLLSRKNFLLAELRFYGYQDETESLPAGIAKQLAPIVEELKLINTLLRELNQEKRAVQLVIAGAMHDLKTNEGSVGICYGEIGSRHGVKRRKKVA
jgi:hypothetical protein